MAYLDASEDAAIDDLIAKEDRMSHLEKTIDRSYLRGLRIISYLMAVRIGLVTGMRQGEIFALTWGNIQDSKIHVTAATDRKSNLKPTKTPKAIRTITLDSGTMEHLKRWKNLQADLLETIGVKQDGETRILCSAVGGALDKNNFKQWWRGFKVDAGFPDLKFHELRHTQATQLLANGVDVKTVQERMGHSKANITLDWYAHATPEKEEEAASIIANVVYGQKKQARIRKLKTA